MEKWHKEIEFVKNRLSISKSNLYYRVESNIPEFHNDDYYFICHKNSSLLHSWAIMLVVKFKNRSFEVYFTIHNCFSEDLLIKEFELKTEKIINYFARKLYTAKLLEE